MGREIGWGGGGGMGGATQIVAYLMMATRSVCKLLLRKVSDAWAG